MQLLVTMGYRTPRTDTDFGYVTAGLVQLDWRTKRVVRELEYVSPPEHAPPFERMVFGCGHLLDARTLLVPTFTELVWVDLERFAITRVFSLPQLNDVHHAIAFRDRIWICNTGLESVVAMTPSGEILETVSLKAGSTWENYDAARDYRGTITKPHDVHANHLFVLDDALWVTRFHQGDAIRLDAPSDRLVMEVGNPHDGVVLDGRVHFTTTNGHVVVFDAATRRRVQALDLNGVYRRKAQLGWCRGIAPVGDGRAFVGFGQFRRTKHREYVHWIKNDGKAKLPTRIALVDLAAPALVDEFAFTGKWEGAAIYSVLRLAGV